MNKLEKTLKNISTILLPLIQLDKKNNLYIITLSPIIFLQLNGLPNHHKYNNSFLIVFLEQIKNKIGAFLTNDLHIWNYFIKKNLIIENKYMIDNIPYGFSKEIINSRNKFELEPNVIEIKQIKGIDRLNECPHGWMSGDTLSNLKYVLSEFRPKNIIELGSWYGKSSSFIKSHVSEDANLYCCDKFQSIYKSNYGFWKFSPLDYFYMNYSRYECFYKKMSSFKNVWMVNGDIFKNIELFYKYKIPVDMIFIDFLKKKFPLINFLQKLTNYFPKAIIVGDDYVFKTVKEALLYYLTKNDKYTGILEESYIISPFKLNNYSKIYKENMLLKNKKDTNPYKLVIKSINSNLIEETLDLCKKLKVDLNKQLSIHNKNTLYHLIAIMIKNIYSDNEDKINEKLKLFYEYQLPSYIYNDLLLTYKDYIKYNINFS